MPAVLREDGDKLVLKLGGSKSEFQDQLAKAKMVAGRRYNPDDKTWEFPNDLETLMKVVHTIEPELPAELAGKLKDAKAKVAEELVTKLPDDAALAVPWRDRLAPKQRSGVDFLAEHPHSLLGDEMGSGKTVQAISTVFEYGIRQKLHNEPALVVAPNSVTGVWVRELEKWANQPATVVDGKTPAKRKAQLQDGWVRGDWIIINWEKLRLMPELAKYGWSAVIADEAHRAKNRKAQQTKALWKLKAPVQLALTGTPVMNDPGELWSVLKWLRPEQYTSYWAFFYSYTEYYDGYHGKIVTGVKNADALRFELADKMVRRTKREIHSDIPEPFDPLERIIPMKPKQQKLYDEAVKAFWLEIAQEVEAGELKLDPNQLKTAVESDNPETLKMMIPNAASRCVRLRQIATSPAILGGPDESGKLDAVIETITDATDERPFVVFCWYKPTVRLILERLRKQKISCDGFTGDTPQEEREPLAQSFQRGDFQVIVPTIAAGGTGIDLFRASDVLLAEQDWTPAINQQAIDRCDRKGQKVPIQTQFFRSADSVETGRIAPKNRLKDLIVTSILGAEK